MKNEPNLKEALEQATERAIKYYDGHFTLMRFTTSWRFGFGTPLEAHEEIEKMAAGSTAASAIQWAIDFDATKQKRRCPTCGC